MIDTTAGVETLAEMTLARQVAEALNAQYPGHLWAVHCSGGVVNVQNLRLSGRWGFTLHARQLVNQDIAKRAMQAGGELLERYRISRGRGGVEESLIRKKAVMDRPWTDVSAPT